MKNLDLLTLEQLEELIEVKREELNELFCKYGVNDFVLRKSKEIEELTNEVQRCRLEEYLNEEEMAM